MDKIPLNYEASQGDTNKQETPSLPLQVVQCLENARFLHLATCADNVPQVSLMNYTYLPSSAYSRSPVIVMTTNTASRKTANIAANSNVSLLVHDWVSHRPPTQARRPSGSPVPSDHRSSLANLLFNLNSSAVSSISATIAGTARICPPGSPEEQFYVAQHLQNNTFDDEDNTTPDSHISTPQNYTPPNHDDNQNKSKDACNQNDSTNTQNDSKTSRNDSNDTDAALDDDARRRGSHFVAGQDVRLIVVDIKSVRISDFKGTVRDWVLVDKNEGGLSNGIGQGP